MIRITNALHTKFLEGGAHNVALTKKVTELLGYRGGKVRPPLSSPDESFLVGVRESCRRRIAEDARPAYGGNSVNAPEDVRSKALAPHQRVVATKGPATGASPASTTCSSSCSTWTRACASTAISSASRLSARSDRLLASRLHHGERLARAARLFRPASGRHLPLADRGRRCEAPAALDLGSSFWPGENAPPHAPEKLDHFAFDVPTFEDLVWFQRHLRDNGVAVSDIVPRSKPPRFVDSIYFNDPSGIPLEIATWNRSDPLWKKQRPEDWYSDTDPVPSLLA
jgi:catechol 2,3-dioxygenase-like lactoylglutathione lyase family enzyme